MSLQNAKLFELEFPFGGVHESAGVAAQPAGTSAYARNVRGYDPLEKRDRGGQRAGIQKYIAAAVDTGPIREMCTRVRVNPGSSVTRTLWSFTPIGQTIAHHTLASPGDATYLAYDYTINGTQDRIVPTGTTRATLVHQPLSQTYDSYIFAGALYGNTAANGTTLMSVEVADPTPSELLNPLNGFASSIILVSIRNDGCIVSFRNGFAETAQTFTAFTNNALMEFTITITQNQVTVAIVGRSTKTFTPSSGTTLDLSSRIVTPHVSLFHFATDFGAGPIALVATDSTDFSVVAEQLVFSQNSQLYIGTREAGFNQLDASLLSGGIAYTDGHEHSIVAAGGNYWLASADWPLRTVSILTGTVDEPAATAGSIPSAGVSTKYAQLLALYRDRLFHGRFVNSPYNYFASKSGDSLDYDYGSLSQAGAFAGSTAQQAGLLDDILTAMVPFGDQAMVMGMANSMAVMRGDPKSGGSIDTISREVGIVSPHAWARTPDNQMFFMGRDGLYRMGPSGSRGPESIVPLSRGRLDATLGHIDFATTRVVMQWDPQELGLKIYLIPPSYLVATTVIFWEQRKNAFWIDTYPAGIGPTAACASRGRGADSVIVLGCFDGLLRALDLTAVGDDDGHAISSVVQYPPQQFLGPMVNAKITQTRMLTGGTSSFNAVYSLLMGNDPISAASATADFPRTLTLGGYQAIDRQRHRGSCAILQIANSVQFKTWEIERAALLVSPSGRVRT